MLEKKESYFKCQMNGFKDPELNNFQFLSYSPMLKTELKSDATEKEYIDSYINAARIIAENSKIQNPAIIFAIKTYSLALPCIFLCRQALELSIKRGINIRNEPYKAIHSLQKLWEKFEDIVSKEITSPEEQKLFKDMKSFIVLVSEFDNENGTKLRYSEDKNRNLSQEKLVFVNLNQITETTSLFIEQMSLLSNNT